MVRYNLDKSMSLKMREGLPIKGNWERQTRKGFWASKFVEFCKRTDLHGYKYIVMKGLSNLERSCWAIAVIISIAFTAYFVVTAYRWYARNPIVTLIESTQGAIWDVPFPAVTICSLNMISRRAARAFANNMTLPENVTADFVFETLRLAPLLHSSYITSSGDNRRLYVLQEVLDLNRISTETLFKTLSPAASCSQLVQRCMWKNTIYRCDQLFQQVLTPFNLCCSFNYYAVQASDRTNVNSKDELFHFTEPRRVASCGYQSALTVLLNTDLDDYYSASVASQGALVFIDSAYDVPNQDSPVRMVNPSTEVLVALSPERTYSTSGIRAFSPDQRQCYYSDEVKMGNFRQYSLHNCIAFQNVERIKKICECVPFFFPIKEYPRKCNFFDLECLKMALRPMKDAQRDEFDKEEIFNCLPECEHYDYQIEVAMGKLASSVRLNGLPFFNNVNLANSSLINVFFNDLVSTRYRRDVYLNWQNILAAFGGLLSLMLGFTLISGVDILLFFTIRLAYRTVPKSEKDKQIHNWMKHSMKRSRLMQKDYGKWKFVKPSGQPKY